VQSLAYLLLKRNHPALITKVRALSAQLPERILLLLLTLHPRGYPYKQFYLRAIQQLAYYHGTAETFLHLGAAGTLLAMEVNVKSGDRIVK
jgi:hypothetical protein